MPPPANLHASTSAPRLPRTGWPRWLLPVLKAVLHLALLAPLAALLLQFRSGALAQQADPVNYITHFTGNWALWILLASLAITPLRRLSPALAPIVRVRRLVGLYAFLYATLHLATYVFLFSGFDAASASHALLHGRFADVASVWHDTWPTIKDDLLRRRFIQVGLFAWFLLLLLALTSPQFTLRALGGPAWRRVHSLVYLAAVAAVVHFWWLVKSGNREPWKDTAILAVLLGARLLWAVRNHPPPRTPSRSTPPA